MLIFILISAVYKYIHTVYRKKVYRKDKQKVNFINN